MRGPVVVRFLGSLGLGLVAVASLVAPALPEELALPFACRSEHGEIRLEAAHEIAYRIVGKREEQIFTSCSGSSTASCTSMMLHKFQIDCSGELVGWARVAQAASGFAIVLPRDLPAGFAPISSLGGRLILPAQGPASPLVRQVSSEALEPIEPVAEVEPAPSDTGSWSATTLVEARAEPVAGAGRVGWSVGAVLLMMLAASLIASGRWRVFAYAVEDWPGAKHDLRARVTSLAGSLRTSLRNAVDGLAGAFKAAARRSSSAGDPGAGASTGLAGLFAMAESHLAKAEAAIASLSPSLLLRDVLAGELHRAHARFDQLHRDAARLESGKAEVIVRSLIREFDRIERIAQSAAISTHASGRDETRMPVTLPEAYEVLGLNANASPVAAKKLIDALRLSWHPDHATSEDDRRLREARIKQINAAWTIIQGPKVAA